jgi:hypothetical protein
MTVSDYERVSGHRASKCPPDCDRHACMICEGGLFLCTVCGALEGALLPVCPGRWLSMEEHDENYKQYCAKTGPFAA